MTASSKDLPPVVSPIILIEALLPLSKNRIPMSMFAPRLSLNPMAYRYEGYDGEAEKQI